MALINSNASGRKEAGAAQSAEVVRPDFGLRAKLTPSQRRLWANVPDGLLEYVLEKSRSGPAPRSPGKRKRRTGKKTDEPKSKLRQTPPDMRAALEAPGSPIYGKHTRNPFSYTLAAGLRSDYVTIRGELGGFLAFAAKHQEREVKEGVAFIDGLFDGDGRGDPAVHSKTALTYDLDGKMGLAEIDARIEASGLEAISYTTNGHKGTKSDIAVSSYQGWAKRNGRAETPTQDSFTAFIAATEKTNHHRDVVLLHGGEPNNDKYEFTHAPVDKVRVVFFITEIILIKSDVGISKVGYQEIYRAVGLEHFGEAYDKACTNLSRLNYLPSHKPGAEFGVTHYPGALLDWRRYWTPDVIAEVAEERSARAERRATFESSPPCGLEKVHHYLNSIPCDETDYPDWLGAGAATHYVTRGSEDGLKLLHDWSATDEARYDPAAIDSMWESFGRSTPETPATEGKLRYLAQKYDKNFREWVDPARHTERVAALRSLGDMSAPARDLSGFISLQDMVLVGEESNPVAFPDMIDGDIMRTQANLIHFLNHYGIKLGRDEFANKRRIMGVPNQKYLTTDAINAIFLALDSLGVRYPYAYLDTILRTLADSSSMHPVRVLYDKLEQSWDGAKRLDTWLINYCGVEDNVYTRELGALTLMAMVRRVREPGAKFDYMPVLEGPGGARKSTLVACLAFDKLWYTASVVIGASAKEIMELTAGKTVVEIEEMAENMRAHPQAWKAFISRQRDEARLSYDRDTSEYERQFVFWGSTNLSQYTRDETDGDRRLCPVYVNGVVKTALEGNGGRKVMAIDIDGFMKVRAQLFGEAAARETEFARKGTPLIFSGAAERIHRQELNKRFERSEQQAELENALAGMMGILPNDEIYEFLGIPLDRRTPNITRGVNALLRKLGWQDNKKPRLGEDKRQCRCWAYGSDPRVIVYNSSTGCFEYREADKYAHRRGMPKLDI